MRVFTNIGPYKKFSLENQLKAKVSEHYMSEKRLAEKLAANIARATNHMNTDE